MVIAMLCSISQDYFEDYPPGSWGEGVAKEFIHTTFGEQPPVVDDNLVTVYEVGTIFETVQLETTIAPIESAQDSWANYATGQPWMISPAFFYVASPRSVSTSLEINLSSVQNGCSQSTLANSFVTLQVDDGASVAAKMIIGQTTRIPFSLTQGSHVMKMAFLDENSPTDGAFCFTFLVHTINLLTENGE